MHNADHSYIGDTPTRSLAPKLSPKQPSFLLSPKQPSFLQKGEEEKAVTKNPTTESSNAGTCVQLDISFFKILHLVSERVVESCGCAERGLFKYV